jgi:6-pyruvoyltetrahydropterin/6-carboxytetrahydropterin synthase
MYQVVKTYGHDIGLSACFRQWRAKSHCSLIHGYALAVELTFEAPTLDDRGWVIDFGGMKPLKETLERMFDHKLLVAQDDPELDTIASLAGLGIADVIVLPMVGCEAFAFYVYNHVYAWLTEIGQEGRVQIVSVKVSEHAGNSAVFKPYNRAS